MSTYDVCTPKRFEKNIDNIQIMCLFTKYKLVKEIAKFQIVQ